MFPHSIPFHSIQFSYKSRFPYSLSSQGEVFNPLPCLLSLLFFLSLRKTFHQIYREETKQIKIKMSYSNINILLIMSLSCVLISTTHALRLIEMAPSSAPSATEEIEGDFRPEVKSFCKGTKYPQVCADTIFWTSHVEPINALKIHVEAILEASMEVSKGTEEKIVTYDEDTSKSLRKIYETCSKVHKRIQKTIKETNVLLDQLNVADAYSKFSSVVSDNSECNQEVMMFNEDDFSISFTVPSSDIYELGENCLSIMEGIVSQQK